MLMTMVIIHDARCNKHNNEDRGMNPTMVVPNSLQILLSLVNRLSIQVSKVKKKCPASPWFDDSCIEIPSVETMEREHNGRLMSSLVSL